MPPDLRQALIDTLRTTRQLDGVARAQSEAVHASLDIIAELNAEIDRLRAQVTDLRAQTRALMSGRSVADERADVEREMDPT